MSHWEHPWLPGRICLEFARRVGKGSCFE